MGDYPAARLCDLASDWLAVRYPGALIVRELSVGKWGKALIDIAAITDTDIIGVEIKGDGDSGARLELQGRMYSRVATHMFLLTAPSLDKVAEKHMPEGWWHLRVVDETIQGGKLDVVSYGYQYGPPRLPNAPAQMLECLITRELKLVGRELTPTQNIGRTVPTMIATISEHAPLARVRPAVCEALRRRDWHKYDRSIGKSRDARYRWSPPAAISSPAGR